MVRLKRIIVVFIFLFLFLLNCKSQKQDSESRDSLKIDIPLEFYIKNNSNTNYDFVGTKFFINKEYISLGDYENIDKNTKEAKREDWEISKGEDNTITSRVEKLYIDMEDAKRVFKKYAVNKDIVNFRDSAKIVSYKEFRKDFPEIIKKMEKVPDTIQITTRDNGEKKLRIEKIQNKLVILILDFLIDYS